MNKERFDYLRVQSEQGRDVFVKNPQTDEEGLVTGCTGDNVVVQNTKGEERHWDYRQLEELTRSKHEWPRRD